MSLGHSSCTKHMMALLTAAVAVGDVGAVAAGAGVVHAIGKDYRCDARVFVT